MPIIPFFPDRLICVPTTLWSFSEDKTLEVYFLFDTGSNRCSVQAGLIKKLGYDVEAGAIAQVKGLGIQQGHWLNVKRFSALEKEVSNFPLFCLNLEHLPPPLEGIIGASFLKGMKFYLDYEKGQLIRVTS